MVEDITEKESLISTQRVYRKISSSRLIQHFSFLSPCFLVSMLINFNQVIHITFLHINRKIMWRLQKRFRINQKCSLFTRRSTGMQNSMSKSMMIFMLILVHSILYFCVTILLCFKSWLNQL